MASRSSSARLRKTFKYPDSDDSEPEALDEEEQLKLISALKERNSKTNRAYTAVFTAFPLLLIINFLPPFTTTTNGRFIILSISSLLCTAWTMYFLPEGRTGIPILDNFFNPKKAPRNVAQWKGKAKVGDLDPTAPAGPVEKHIPLLNVVLAGLILLWGSVTPDLGISGVMFLRLSHLPSLALGVILVVKTAMGSVDVEELEKLRYGYRGA